MANMDNHATELREINGSIIICYDGSCFTWSISGDTHKVYGDTFENTGNFVLVDYNERRVFLGRTIEDCYEAWLRRRIMTDKPIKLVAVDVKYADH
ncbi:MAG: hypothetical protein JHC26_01905 [Thermofilum sp.]|jgi:hypothetical protein|uniref:hypothetical protein n=1 Tax=Thermofilum sp. TaxID=1961369 RepID=UPI00258B23B1|nr:hypothetical protein [Thermofilum sp.]MCI4407817.1 hypothetical protein [Thermofilum sp.]